LVRIDMSEFMEKFAVSRLTGAPPGYVGYEEGGQLTEAVRRKPYSVVLLDEIEKAHPDVFNILLQVFDAGQLTDNLGHKVDFKNTIVIMTSNIGTRDLQKSKTMGFQEVDDTGLTYQKMKERVLDEVKKVFRPEFMNRIDDIIVFHPLSREHIRKIIDLMLNKVIERMKEQELNLEITDEVKEFLIEKGFNPQFGARPLRRAIQKFIEDSLAEQLLSKKFERGKPIKIELKENNIVYNQ